MEKNEVENGKLVVYCVYICLNIMSGINFTERSRPEFTRHCRLVFIRHDRPVHTTKHRPAFPIATKILPRPQGEGHSE
jgi:hypothetical protein